MSDGTRNARRTFFKASAALAAAAALPAGALAAETQGPEAKGFDAQDHWAQKGDVKLWLYRKRAAAKASEKPPVVFLVHGSSISSRAELRPSGAGIIR